MAAGPSRDRSVICARVAARRPARRRCGPVLLLEGEVRATVLRVPEMHHDASAEREMLAFVAETLFDY